VCLFEDLFLLSLLNSNSIIALLNCYLSRVKRKALSSLSVEDFHCFWCLIDFRLSRHEMSKLHFRWLCSINQTKFLGWTHSRTLCWLSENRCVESVSQFVFVVLPGFSVEVAHRFLFLLRLLLLPNQLTSVRIELHLLVDRVMQNHCVILIQFDLTFANVVLIVQKQLQQVLGLSAQSIFEWRGRKRSHRVLLISYNLTRHSWIVHEALTRGHAVTQVAALSCAQAFNEHLFCVRYLGLSLFHNYSFLLSRFYLSVLLLTVR